MKTTSLKAILILVGSMLFGTETVNAVNNQFNYFVKNEASAFNTQGLYAILGVIVSGLILNFISGNLNKTNKSVSYSKPRHQHHRAVIKKTQ